MDIELDKSLCENFPLLYRQRHFSKIQTCMCWGFSCDNGWEPLIRELSEKIEPLIEEIKKNSKVCFCGYSKNEHNKGKSNCNQYEPRHPSAAQVKEKYGTLHFYMDYSTEEIDKIVDEYEDKSAKICERCGADSNGPKSVRGWVVTLCNDCLRKN